MRLTQTQKNEGNKTFPWNKKILELNVKDYIFGNYHFLVEINTEGQEMHIFIWTGTQFKAKVLQIKLLGNKQLQKKDLWLIYEVTIPQQFKTI